MIEYSQGFCYAICMLMKKQLFKFAFVINILITRSLNKFAKNSAYDENFKFYALFLSRIFYYYA